MEAVVFLVAAVWPLAGALGVVLQRNPFYSVLALVVHLVALAALFLLLHAEFLAAAQVIVYAGAVMVLYVFVVAYVGGLEDPLTGRTRSCGVGAAVRRPRCGRALDRDPRLGPEGDRQGGRRLPPGSARRPQIGELFLTKFLIPFEVVSLLLLVAAIGAVARARRGPDAGGRAERPAPGSSDGHRLVPGSLGAIFCIGAAGVLTRRSPLVVLICLELMLNGGTSLSPPSPA